MPLENVEIVRRLFETLSRRDAGAVAALLHPDIEWHVTDIFVETPVHRGREAVVTFLGEFADAWEGIRIELDDVREDGQAVIASGRLVGQASASGIDVDASRAWVVELRDGLVWRWRSFTSLPEALEAVGLRE